MKTKVPGVMLIALITVSFSASLLAQKGTETGTPYGKGEDSISCIRNLSMYSEYYKHENYKDAIIPWREIYNNCPGSRESLYANGVNMYKSFIEAENDTAKIARYCDTIMMIYDKRIKYFGNEGNVLGRKGVDLLRYRRDDGPFYINEGYKDLKRSVELDKDQSSPVVLTTYISASISLFLKKMLTSEQVVNDYIIASDILEKQLAAKPSPKTQQAKDAIDLNMKENKVMTCELIVSIFAPKLEANKKDPEFLKKVTGFLSDALCENEKLYADASESLYAIEPSAQAAFKLARVFLQAPRQDYQKSLKYYKEAIESSILPEEKATFYYEMAIVYNSHLNQPENAANALYEALKLKPNWGDAYILLGSVYVAGSASFDDAFAKKTIYWLAVDMFQKAKSVDPTVTEKANSLIASHSQYFPTVEDAFFYGLKDGQSYTVGGWINRTTTVRGKK